MKWTLVAVIVLATTCADLLQSAAMKRHGEIRSFRPGSLWQSLKRVIPSPFVLASILFMAVSFAAFLKLLTLADLSFAVPATAGTYVTETLLARVWLKEHVSQRRWAGVLLVGLGVMLVGL